MPDPSPHPITLLRKVLEAARAGTPLPPDAAAFMLTAVDTYEAANGRIKMDQAMGLTRAGGPGPWWQQEARERRNDALRRLYATCYVGLSITDAIDRMIRLADRRRRATTLPQSQHDQLMDQALKSGADFPKKRQLRGILGNSPQ